MTYGPECRTRAVADHVARLARLAGYSQPLPVSRCPMTTRLAKEVDHRPWCLPASALWRSVLTRCGRYITVRVQMCRVSPLPYSSPMPTASHDCRHRSGPDGLTDSGLSGWRLSGQTIRACDRQAGPGDLSLGSWQPLPRLLVYNEELASYGTVKCRRDSYDNTLAETINRLVQGPS